MRRHNDALGGCLGSEDREQGDEGEGWKAQHDQKKVQVSVTVP